ncbi:hypothetical protein F0M18_14355 [Pseudohalioglobus sediminis]|uniref:TRAP transporter solute receptor, TAXI family n=1 Tax=Pseudohalioglobus sediminis TaxID=2606449 RepID=A0A5B0WTD0_9GAMM|nr:TAXI family TRAP transporter solute-binding subunit [Pseudohalioglobus sediminis]KAA1189535.1 hypothetical protein F0M18_14355 [Pseudohalioglobus sediminis]
MRFQQLPFLACALALLLIKGCELTRPELRMLVTNHEQLSHLELKNIIEEQSQLRLSEALVPPDVDPLEALRSGETDLALVENSAAFVPGVRAVLPAYESVLHIAIRNDYNPADYSKPLMGAQFYAANRSAAAASFIDVVTRRQELQPGQFGVSREFDANSTDIIVYFGPINPEKTGWLPPGFSLVSLDNQFNPQRDFYKEGIGYLVPNMKPKLIPAFTYELPGNREPLLTVAVDTLLVTRKDVAERAIYELTRTFLEQKQRLTALAPHLFAGINESFDPLDLSFPLHEGARAYLEREEPGFLERYAELINLLVYIAFLMISAFLAFTRWREHRRKDRIDVFYDRVLAIRDGSAGVDIAARLEALDALEREAFASLVAEKLAANESFRILTDLIAVARDEVRYRANDAAAAAKQTPATRKG